MSSFWKGKRVFVTGCFGFLGSWIATALVEQGAMVVGLVRDRLPSSYLSFPDVFRRVTEVHGEVGNLQLLERIISEYEIDTVFHLAAQSQVGVAQKQPVETFEVNVRGTWNLLEACRRQTSVRRVVVASSDKAYGPSDKLPYDEKLPLAGRYPYDVSKSCADLISISYFQTYGLPVCITRCANLFGGGDLNFNRIIPGTIRSAYLDEPPIIRSDGQFVRDYLYVKDAVEAYLLIAEKMEEKEIRGEAFNVSSAVALSVLDITRKLLLLMKRDHLEPEILNIARAEIQEQRLSAVKLKSLLGWVPRYSMEQALQETILWYERFWKAQKECGSPNLFS